jgi:hypothetical protein
VVSGVPFAFANTPDQDDKDEQGEAVAGAGNPDLWPLSPGGLR